MSVSYDCTATLRAQEHGHQPVVAGIVGRQGAKSGSVGFEEGISPTLRQGITTDLVYVIQGNGIDRADTAGCNGKGWRENECYTLNTIDRPAVMYDCRDNGDGERSSTLTGDHQNRVTDYTSIIVWPEITGSLCANSHPGSYTGQDAFNNMLPVVPSDKLPRKYIIRRLTPLECCRLQGFPDYWMDGVEGSDSAKYKMWGNGMALPNMLHVMQGIVRMENQSERS